MPTAKLTRKRVILAKIESGYGVDPTPTGASNAILIKNMEVTPIAATTVGRDFVRDTLGNFDQLIANKHLEVSFEVELAGAGTAGNAPAYGPLLRACALSQTLLASALTGTAQAGAASTITLASGASASDDAYNGMVITTTGGTGSGQTGVILDYNGTTKVATMMSAWGVTPDATTTYSIGACAVYRPVSTGFESVTIYAYIDGLLHKGTGCRGTAEFMVGAAGIPSIKFTMTGIFNTVTDESMPSTTLTAFQYPLVANYTNTPEFKFFGVSGIPLESISINLNNTVDFRALIGEEYTQITDRKSEGQAVFEMQTLATLDLFGIALGTSNGAITLVHGTSTGNKVRLTVPKADVGNPTYGDSNSVVMANVPFSAIPYNGNDEVFITVY